MRQGIEVREVIRLESILDVKPDDYVGPKGLNL